MNHTNMNKLSQIKFDEKKFLSKNFWLTRLNEAEFLNFPYLPKINHNYYEIGKEISSEKLKIFNSNKIMKIDSKYYNYEAILTVLLIYFSKINNYKEFYICYNHEESLDLLSKDSSLNSKNIILKIHLNSKLNFKESCNYVKNELENLNIYKSSLIEFLQNDSLLTEKSNCKKSIPLAINIVKNIDYFSIPKENYVTILLSENGMDFRIVL
ncbi:hypothetical protein, partial [Silvanigrella aquatica]|uniref:hypothetical protein n=1 Tax=Silvanigrella aquatica TaxID=1915309 RepID=UPI001E3CD29B